jgi:tetratricopeptide (TPR) repeat protein
MREVERVAAFAAALSALKDRSGQSFRALAGPSLTSAAALHRYCTGLAVPPDFTVVMRFAKANRASRADLAQLHQLWLQARLAVEGEVAVTPAPSNVITPPAQLPLGVAGFVGRHLELKELSAHAHIGEVTPVVVVTGPAGIGKTALVVHWAHQAVGSFPDGQLYANLRGFDSSGVAKNPADALRAFLDALAVPPQQIPANLDAQIGLYRSLLAGRRTLVVLDNAKDAEQVRPLLPGSPDCMAIVTSRSNLSGLVTAEAAHPIALDLLTNLEARHLVGHRIGPERTDAEPNAVDAIIARCMGLPLALAIVAARAATRPRMPLKQLAIELTETGSSLDPFADTDPSTDLRAVFSWSYLALSPPAARLFRLLGLVPRIEMTPESAASLAGLPLRQTVSLLAELTKAHLITEGRDLHDLLYTYAGEQAYGLEPETERHQAVYRIVEHYLQRAYAANCLLQPVHQLTRPPGTPYVFAGPDEAREWILAEQDNLRAVIETALSHELNLHAQLLAQNLCDFLHRQARWLDGIPGHLSWVLAARRARDPAAEAHALRSLGLTYARVGRVDEARSNLDAAIAVFRRLGDRHGLARTHRSASMMLDSAGEVALALPHAETAHRLFRELGDEPQEGKTLNLVGWCHARLGNLEAALLCGEEALALTRKHGDRHAESATLDTLGFAQHELGNFDQAVVHYQEALVIAQGLAFQAQETETLTHLGDAYAAAGDLDAARSAWQRALERLDELQHPAAAEVRKRLGS